MVAFLGDAARFNDGVFRDSPCATFDRAKFNVVSRNAAPTRTPAERELIRLHDTLLTREDYKSPVLQFVEDHTEPGFFHYPEARGKGRRSRTGPLAVHGEGERQNAGL